MKVLVCGGRDFGECRSNSGKTIAQATHELHFMLGHLKALHAEYNFTHLIHGGAFGADYIADHWARYHQPPIPVTCYAADWLTWGKAAGTIRNQQMLDEGKPQLVVAFPGGRGTTHMLRIAKEQGFPTREVSTDEAS